MRLYVGHDGSMIRLAAGLGLGKTGTLRWPAFGSEFVLEVAIVSPPTARHSLTAFLVQVWMHGKAQFVRVMHEGRPVEALKWVPLENFILLLEGNVPDQIYTSCMAA
jgi:hypothetical protein